MKRYNIYLLVLLVSSTSLFGQSKLDEYLKTAQQNNPGLKASYAEFEAAMQKIPQMSSLDDPNFRVSSFGQMVETRTGQQMARFSLEQMFPWFGTLTAAKDAAALNAEAMFESYKNNRNALALAVKESYYPLYELDQAIRINEDNLKILETYKTLAISKFQNGRGKLSDALRVDIMTNELNTEIAILKEKKKPLVIAFNKLLNRDELADVVVDSLSDVTTVKTMSRDSLQRNPRMEELRKKVLAAQAAERVAVKQSMPKLGLGVEYIITQKRPEMTFADNGKDAYMAMFSVSLPIYRKKYKAAIQETQFMQTSFTEMQHQVENDLISQYEMVRFELDRNQQQLALYEKQVMQTRQIITLLTTAVSNNEADFEEILQMQQVLLKYELLEISTKKEYAMAMAKLDYLTAQ